ncbi:MAG TPA: hypothetical protein VIL86_18670 [Tepidisphaeraceae bacterium]|jgi:hypothetical protein
MKLKAPRRRRDLRSLKTVDPDRNLPALFVHVLGVQGYSGDPMSAVWTFDQPVADPTGTVEAFTVNGSAGMGWFRLSPSALRIMQGTGVFPGGSYSVAEGAGGVAGLQGQTLPASSGMVSA